MMTSRARSPLGRAAAVLGAAACAFAAATSPSAAWAITAPPGGLPPFEAAAGEAIRPARIVQSGQVPRGRERAWKAFFAETGGAFHASFDVATQVPSRLWGRGMAVPGSIASPAVAASFAQAMLARHIDLLAPGAEASDFILVSNDLENGTRRVGFFQLERGLRVIGGQVSFRFKNDRLFVIGSEALPFARTDAPQTRIGDDVARDLARSWVLSDRAADATPGEVAGPFVLPLVGAGQVLAYHTVLRVTVEARAPIGRFAVYLDARTGTPVAREQLLHFAAGTLLYNAPVRYPLSTRQDYPAPGVTLTIDGLAAASDAVGAVSWAGSAQASLDAQLVGPLAKVTNDAGPAAQVTLPIDPGGVAIWNDASTEGVDAQLSSYVHAHIVKAYAKTIAPQMNWLNAQLPVTVNINDTCNAYSDGTSINFYEAGGPCENTGRLADVVYHEFGHSFHNHAIVPGVGAFDGALSEGVSDYLAATITGDSGTARGFFKSSQPLREIDPPNKEHVWPDDIDGDTHETGLIIAGAMWDLRKALVLKLGDTAGVTTADHLYYEMLRGSVDIPSTYAEVLAADDDDGDLENGTPNVCEINAAFGAHGLRSVAASVPAFGAVPPSASGYDVTLHLAGIFKQCAADTLDGVTLDWRLREAPDTAGSLAMLQNDLGAFVATIPPQASDTVIEYRVSVAMGDGGKLAYPDNLADPWYQLYVGEVAPIYCTDFESDPTAEGWTHGLTKGEESEGADDWQWGTLGGNGGGGDPLEAFSGNRVLGNDLGKGNFNGQYQADKINYALSPVIATTGFSTVRLQYWRWLAVEDAHFDQGSIYANDKLAWQNLDSDSGDNSDTNHADKEWRFHDLDLTKLVEADAVQIKFEIASDGGLELGGWTLDDFCVVGVEGPTPSCGDGHVDEGEACDEGEANSDTASGACRTDCTEPSCGDGVIDGAEACDDGNEADGDGCAYDCTIPDEELGEGGGAAAPRTQLTVIDNGCGCVVAGDRGTAPRGLWLAAPLAALALARRRRTRR